LRDMRRARFYNTSHRPVRRNAEADYLFSEELTKKRKFRLLLHPLVEVKLEGEFPHLSNDLEAMIQAKFHSLGIKPVEVKAYRRLDRHKTDDKTFSVIFESSQDARAALRDPRLDFVMSEARPSPSYHVRFAVLRRVSVYEGKCFGKRVLELRKGDIVTANQERGNKLRIIRHRAYGSDMEYELNGWVLLRTKEEELLRRIELVEGDSLMKERRRPAPPKEQSVVKQQRNYPRPAKCNPYRVLADVQVWKGRRDSSIVLGRLERGDVVWANQQKGCMLRIVRTDRWGKIRKDRSLKPESWGWVSMRRKDGKQLLELMPQPMPKQVYGEYRGYQDRPRSFPNQQWSHLQQQHSSRAENHTFNIASLKHIQEFKPRRASNSNPHEKRVSVFSAPTPTSTSGSLSPLNSLTAAKREGIFTRSVSPVSTISSPANAGSLDKMNERSKVLRFSLGGHEADLGLSQGVSARDE